MSAKPPGNRMRSIELNIPQWRMDIQTFVEATTQELVDLTNELSNSLANPGTDEHLRSCEVTEPESGAGNSQNLTDARLAQIKKQLKKKQAAKGNC